MAGVESQLKNQQVSAMNDPGKEKPRENANPEDVKSSGNSGGEPATDADENASGSEESGGDEEETITTPSGVTVSLIKLLYTYIQITARC